MSVKKLTELAVLTAAALIIFIIELQIPNPFPVPGIKLGLANIITVYAVYHYKPYETAMIVAVRLLLGSIFSGNVSALIYSASGSFLCLLGMLLLKRMIDERHIWLSSVFGAVMHNTGPVDADCTAYRVLSVFACVGLSGRRLYGAVRTADYSQAA